MWNLCDAEFFSSEIIIVNSELTISFFTETFSKWPPPTTTTSPPLFLSLWAQILGSGNRRWGTTSSLSTSGASLPVLQAAWDENSKQVQGIIGSHISQMLCPHISTTCADTWTNLKTRFGTPGISEIAADMYAAYSMKLLASHNPHPNMERMNMLFERLRANSMTFSDTQQGLILLNVIPKEWLTVAQIHSQAN